MSNEFDDGFGPLVPTCKKYGISRTVAFKLVRKDLLATFTIGRRRYVRLKSLLSLPERLAATLDGSDQDPTT